MATTFEEAKECPKCGRPGEDVGSRQVLSKQSQQMVTVHTIFCRTELCKWFNTSWVIQVNPDGSIPAPYSQLGAKQYPQLSPESAARVQEAIDHQLKGETGPGGLEVRNPRG